MAQEGRFGVLPFACRQTPGIEASHNEVLKHDMFGDPIDCRYVCLSAIQDTDSIVKGFPEINFESDICEKISSPKCEWML